MRAVVDSRACKILYNFIISNHIEGKVLLPSNICPDVVETLRYANMDLVFCDVSKETLCMDENELMGRLEEAQAVLFVHTYGTERGFDELFGEIKKAKPEVAIIDDKCLCMIDASLNQNSLADLVLFSTGSKKQIDLGSGGFGFVADTWDYYETKGNCCWMNCLDGNWQDLLYIENGELRFSDELCCRINDMKSHRDTLNSIYKRNLPKEIQLPESFQQWRFNIWVENKDEVLQTLFSNGLFASGHYKPFDERCENSKDLFHHVINLFEDGYYTEDQANRTCNLINGILVG